MASSTNKFISQADKISQLMNSASLKTAAPGAAPQQEENPAPVVVEDLPQTQPVKKARPKNLRAVPEIYFDAHETLKVTNKTSLDFSAYILEALREKLERDGGL